MNPRFALALVFACCSIASLGRTASAQSAPAAPSVDAPTPPPSRPPAPSARSAPFSPSAALPPAEAPPISVPVPLPPPSNLPGMRSYESCAFPDHLTIVDRVPLSAGVTTRAAETSHGTIPVQLEGGERIVFAYPGEDLFANVKLEKLPAKDFLNQKHALIEDFNHTLAQSPRGARNYSLPARLRGFEIYGLDRVELAGSVLGIYLFFDDLNRIATTVFFMNQDPATRPFQTIDQYARLRDAFLKTYTACIRTHQGVLVTQ